MSEASRAAFASAARSEPVDLLRACLLIGAEVDPGIDLDTSLAMVDSLAAEVADRLDPADPLPALRSVLGSWRCTASDYADLRSSLLHEVLQRGHGLPIVLSVAWMEVASRAGVDAYGVGLPGHFVVGLGTGAGGPVEVPRLVDPARGGAELPLDEVGGMVRRVGATMPVELGPWGPTAVLTRVLANIRLWADRPDRWRTALWAVELSLLLPHHAVALRRERGQLLARLGDYLGGARELDAYADVVEGLDPDEAAAARRIARMARSRLN